MNQGAKTRAPQVPGPPGPHTCLVERQPAPLSAGKRDPGPAAGRSVPEETGSERRRSKKRQPGSSQPTANRLPATGPRQAREGKGGSRSSPPCSFSSLMGSPRRPRPRSPLPARAGPSTAEDSPTCPQPEAQAREGRREKEKGAPRRGKAGRAGQGRDPRASPLRRDRGS